MEENEKKSKKIFNRVIDILCNILLVVCGTILILRILVFDIGHVPSGSMEPTLNIGCNLLIYKLNPDYQRGDIVVFESEELNKILVKRLIGEPGDHILLDGDKTYINGELVVEDYVKYLTGASEVFEFNVPEGCYLFLGDNRYSSNDARYWTKPNIEEDDLIGEVSLVADTNEGLQIFIPH